MARIVRVLAGCAALWVLAIWPTASPAAEQKPALALLSKSVDEVEKVTWYRDKTTPKTPMGNAVYLYVGAKGDKTWLRVVMQYSGSSWLFAEKAAVVVDGDKRGEYGGRWARDNAAGRVWETLDLQVDGGGIAVIRAMANGKAVTIRFQGRQYISDYKIPAKELTAMKNVLAGFHELGGKL